MGSFSLIHWIIVGIVVLLLFGGRGKISAIMGDVGRGIRSFKDGLNDAKTGDAKIGDAKSADAQKQIDQDKTNSNPPS